MGTNYYLSLKNTLPGSDHVDELHIGKSSTGWCFALHIIPERTIHDLQDWVDIIEACAGDAEIRDEYGDVLTLDELLKVITQRSRELSVEESFNVGRRVGLYKNDTFEQFLQKNHAQPGPNNLLRHKIGQWCVKHGHGTWDCLPGEFS